MIYRRVGAVAVAVALSLAVAGPLTSAATVSVPSDEAAPASPGVMVGYPFKAKRGQVGIQFEFKRVQSRSLEGRTLRGKVLTGYRVPAYPNLKRISKGTATLRLTQWAEVKKPWGSWRVPAVATVKMRYRYCGSPKVTWVVRDLDRDEIWDTFFPAGLC